MMQNVHKGNPLCSPGMVVITCEEARIHLNMLSNLQANIILKPDAYTYFV